MRHTLRTAAVAILGMALAATAARAQSSGAAVTIFQGTVQSVETARHALTVRDDAGATRRLTVAPGARGSLARLRQGAFVILTIREGTVTAIDARGVAATPPPQEVPQ